MKIIIQMILIFKDIIITMVKTLHADSNFSIEILIYFNDNMRLHYNCVCNNNNG